MKVSFINASTVSNGSINVV